MTEHELYVTYKLLYQFITAERLMRLKVFPEGHPQHKRKIALVEFLRNVIGSDDMNSIAAILVEFREYRERLRYKQSVGAE